MLNITQSEYRLILAAEKQNNYLLYWNVHIMKFFEVHFVEFHSIMILHKVST